MPKLLQVLKEAKIGFPTFNDILVCLGFEAVPFNPNMDISEELAEVVTSLCETDIDQLRDNEEKRNVKNKDNQHESNSSIVIIGLDNCNNPKKQSLQTLDSSSSVFKDYPLYNDNNPSFWIEELVIKSPSGNENRIAISCFNDSVGVPLYSVLIGCNGIGKSSIMRDIIEFFIDLHIRQSDTKTKLSTTKKSRLKKIKYHIDGVCCEVIRLEKYYITKIDGKISMLKNLRLPTIVACNFGAFDKFPIQKVNSSSQTRYDLPQYKYVGAHVNGNMISSSAIAFRLLFALNESMNERQRLNICSILDFIGYDHKISLRYSLVQKSKKEGTVRDAISQRIDKDIQYANLSRQEKNEKITKLYNFYKTKIANGNPLCFVVDIDKESTSNSLNELQYIYKLKQCDLVSSSYVSFFKCNDEITSEEMSSGEFAMLSTVLSISAAANDSHTLILLDEPEISLHPNWQMSLIDNLDRALKNQVCNMLVATHSHMLVSDLPMNRSSVIQLYKDTSGDLLATQISESTYGWSAEEVLLKVFKTATDRNRYFGERIGKLLEQIGNNTIKPEDVVDELKELQDVSVHLSDVDPMKNILNTIIEAYR